MIKSAHAKTVKCKCCNGSARLYGVCDFNKNCEELRGKFLELSGLLSGTRGVRIAGLFSQ